MSSHRANPDMSGFICSVSECLRLWQLHKTFQNNWNPWFLPHCSFLFFLFLSSVQDFPFLNGFWALLSKKCHVHCTKLLYVLGSQMSSVSTLGCSCPGFAWKAISGKGRVFFTWRDPRVLWPQEKVVCWDHKSASPPAPNPHFSSVNNVSIVAFMSHMLLKQILAQLTEMFINTYLLMCTFL